MKTQEAIQYFGGVRRLAAALGTWPNTIYLWGELVPKKTACMIEVITHGRLKANLEEYEENLTRDE